MDSLFHFVFASMAALAIDLHKKHRLIFVIAAAAFAVIIDFDHFLFTDPLYAKPLHNLVIAFLLPLALFYVSYRYERNLKPKTTVRQMFFLVLMAMLMGHLIADMFYGQIKFFYPFSYENYTFSTLPFPEASSGDYDFITIEGVAVLVYAIILLCILFAEDFIRWHEEKHESVSKSIRDVVRDFF